MHIKKAAIIGKGAVGLLYGSLIARNIGPGAVEYVMDDDRLARHAEAAVTINGSPCRIRTVGASIAAEEEPVDLLILAIKATGLEQALGGRPVRRHRHSPGGPPRHPGAAEPLSL